MIKKLLKIIGVFLSLTLFSTQSFAAIGSSADYQLDFSETTSNMAPLSSTDFAFQSGGIGTGTNGESADFQFVTKHYIPTICGNGVTEEAEQCDDGNTSNTDACLNTCVSATCGDGYVASGEQCDDGNINAGDGCSATCTTETPTPIPTPTGGGGGGGGGGGDVYRGSHMERLAKAEEASSETPKTTEDVKTPAEEQSIASEKEVASIEATPESEVFHSAPHEEEGIPVVGKLKTPTEESPIVSEKEVASIEATSESEVLHPAAPKEDMSIIELHVDIKEENKKGEVKPKKVLTIDTNPVVVGRLEGDTKYVIVFEDSFGNRLEEQQVTTDPKGGYLYETQRGFDSGKYNFRIVKISEKGEEKTMKEYSVEIAKADYRELTIKSIIEEDTFEVTPDGTLDFGEVVKKEQTFLKGYAEPLAQIFAYFQSDLFNISVFADKNGLYEIPIPEELDLGEHTVDLIQVIEKEDEVLISKNVTAKFTLVEKIDEIKKVATDMEAEDACLMNFLYLYILLLLLLLLLLTTLFFVLFKRRKKGKKLKSRRSRSVHTKNII